MSYGYCENQKVLSNLLLFIFEYIFLLLILDWSKVKQKKTHHQGWQQDGILFCENVVCCSFNLRKKAGERSQERQSGKELHQEKVSDLSCFSYPFSTHTHTHTGAPCTLIWTDCMSTYINYGLWGMHYLLSRIKKACQVAGCHHNITTHALHTD